MTTRGDGAWVELAPHAEADSDHGELWTDEACRVLLVVAPEDYLQQAPR